MSKPVHQGSAPRDRHESQPWLVTRDGRLCQFWHPDPMWRPRGATMPRIREELSCIGPLWSSYPKGTGFVASPLAFFGPAQGSILDFFEP